MRKQRPFENLMQPLSGLLEYGGAGTQGSSLGKEARNRWADVLNPVGVFEIGCLFSCV